MAAGLFVVEVVTPEQSLVSSDARSVVLRTSVGWMTVLDGHTPLIGDVVPCEVRVEQEDGSVIHLAVHGGFFEVDTSPGAAQRGDDGDGPSSGRSTKVTLLAGVAERAEDIDVERAERAKEVAEALLSELAGGARRAQSDTDSSAQSEDLEVVAAQDALGRAELRLSVARATVS
jgi:F-type H+-transporting ATPase subunit epsilon